MKHLIKIALVLLAGVAATFVYGFVALVAHWGVALIAAGSLVATYIGLAFADIPDHQQKRAGRVALGAMLIECAYGALYVMHVQDPSLFAPPLPLAINVPLAILHGAAFSALAFCVSMFVTHGDTAPDEHSELRTLISALAAERSDFQRANLALPRQATFPPPQRAYACPGCGTERSQQADAALAKVGGLCKTCREGGV